MEEEKLWLNRCVKENGRMRGKEILHNMRKRQRSKRGSL